MTSQPKNQADNQHISSINHPSSRSGMTRNPAPIYSKAMRGGADAKKTARRDIATRISRIRSEIEDGVRRNSKYNIVDLAEVENQLQSYADDQIDRGFGELIREACADETAGSGYKRLDHRLFEMFWDRVRQLARRDYRRRDLAASVHASAHVDGILDEIQVLDSLRNFIRRLPPRQRTAFLLRYRNGLTVQEVADALHMSVRNIQILIAKAKDHLNKEFRND